MKLYDVPRNTQVIVVDDAIKVPVAAKDIAKEDIINFHHIDGMYSYCTDSEGQVCHLAAWTEVEIVEAANEQG